MKKLISILIICSMIFMGSISIFAAETDEASESYDLSKLFVNYEEKSLSEMVKYINENQKVYGFIEFFRNHGLNFYDPFDFPEIQIYMSGDYKNTEVWNAFYSRLTDEHSKYIVLNYSRPTTPEASDSVGTVMLGEKGTKRFWINFTDEFFSYIKTLDRLDGNVFIMDFLMNLLSDDVVGISFNWNESYFDLIGANAFNFDSDSIDTFAHSIVGDLNGDGIVNAIDSNLMKKTIVGHEIEIDPFAVDMNGDGDINAQDSLALKLKIIMG